MTDVRLLPEAFVCPNRKRGRDGSGGGILSTSAGWIPLHVACFRWWARPEWLAKDPAGGGHSGIMPESLDAKPWRFWWGATPLLKPSTPSRTSAGTDLRGPWRAKSNVLAGYLAEFDVCIRPFRDLPIALHERREGLRVSGGW